MNELQKKKACLVCLEIAGVVVFRLWVKQQLSYNSTYQLLAGDVGSVLLNIIFLTVMGIVSLLLLKIIYLFIYL